MNKPVSTLQSTVFCGIDVSADSLAVALIEQDQPLAKREFSNSSSGHKALIAWLGKRKAMVRISLEATGIYSLDLALVSCDPEPPVPCRKLPLRRPPNSGSMFNLTPHGVLARHTFVVVRLANGDNLHCGFLVSSRDRIQSSV